MMTKKSTFKEIKKTIKIDVFPYEVVIVVSNDVKQSRTNRNKIFGETRLEQAAAIHSTIQSGFSFIFLKHDAPPWVISHEACHAAWEIMDFIGAEHNNEVMAYLNSFVVEQCCKVMKKWRA